MGSFRHIDKLVFGLLVLGTTWYAVAAFQGLAETRRSQAEMIRKAADLAKEIAKNVKEPPEQDADLYSGVVKSRWEDMPRSMPLSGWHFYPQTPKPRGPLKP